MNPLLLSRALKVIPEIPLLVNLVRQRVRQLIRGHRPLLVVAPGMGFCDVALSEIIAEKLTYELSPGVNPEVGTPIVAFPSRIAEKKAA